MGSTSFGTTANGKTAKEAFANACESARAEYGWRSYSGTIKEKHDFVVIEVPVGTDPREFARGLMEKDDRRIADKWGPAGCVKVADGEYYFFGFASC